MKIGPVGVELLHVDRQRDRQRQTDMMKIIVAFQNFANAPKKDTLATLPSSQI